MIATETTEIDGTTFQVGGLDLRTERAVLLRLTKLLGPSLAELARGGSANAPSALQALSQALDEAEVDFLCTTFAKVTKVQVETAAGVSWVPYTEAAFTKGVGSQFKWLWFCLGHQYRDFLGDGSLSFSGLVADLQAKASPSGSPTT